LAVLYIFFISGSGGGEPSSRRFRSIPDAVSLCSLLIIGSKPYNFNVRSRRTTKPGMASKLGQTDEVSHLR